jgi:hypothetical protein
VPTRAIYLRALGVLLIACAAALTVLLVIRANSGEESSTFPGVALTSPADHDVSVNGFLVAGQSRNIPPGSEIWLAMRGLEPGDTFQPENKPCPRAPSGDWRCAPAFVGGPDDKGKVFEVFVLVADPPAQEAFLQYDRTKPVNAYPGIERLPASAVEVSKFQVTRAD